MSKKKIITFVLSLFIIAAFLFVHPLLNLFGNLDPHSRSLIFLESMTSIPEPVVMFLFGSVLIGIGVYARRKFMKNIS